tara:strand:- start:4312 stop:4722 length:411 start_codon:yes stop_codon:yes gene_type:complete
MVKKFHLDIITPTSIESFENIDYVRIPSLDGLIGVKAKHAQAMIGLGIGEVRITKDNKQYFYSTSGGFADIANEGVQLLLETAEKAKNVNANRAKDALDRAKNRLKDPSADLDRANDAIKRAKNRLAISINFTKNK